MVTETVTPPRLVPLEPPYDVAIADQLSSMTPAGQAPIALFRILVHNQPLAEAMTRWGRYELGRSLSLSLRDREIVIDRTCARCGCEYEWGVHVSYFSGRARLDPAQITSLTVGSADDTCWVDLRDRLLIRAVDSLHDTSDIPDDLWDDLASGFTAAELLDLLVLCGWYHSISFTARAARLRPEPGAPTFSSVVSTTPRSDERTSGLSPG